jgi:hypothetical protein
MSSPLASSRYFSTCRLIERDRVIANKFLDAFRGQLMPGIEPLPGLFQLKLLMEDKFSKLQPQTCSRELEQRGTLLTYCLNRSIQPG